MKSTTKTTTIPKKRASITVLVLGDEGVGKTSLISTFVARYFPENVPGLMTRVRLPQDPDTSSVTTVIDSQHGDAALTAKIEATTATATSSATTSKQTTAKDLSTSGSMMMVDNIDSIILVYDLDRIETFARIEHYWLPLIERCYAQRGNDNNNNSSNNIPVIVAGNKMDLCKPTTSTAGPAATGSVTATSGATGTAISTAAAAAPVASISSTTATTTTTGSTRQQIVSIMSRYRFVRQWIKCSAKLMLRVDDMFLKAQQAVVYPIEPLYDLDNNKMTNECIQALSRIFRMYDIDHDSLLSDYELQKFQSEAFDRPIFDKDINGWKKLITRQYPNELVLEYPKKKPSSSTGADDEDNRQNNPHNNNGKYFTLMGFLAIFDIFISQNRLEHCWKVLRKFGYQDNLQLDMSTTFATTTPTTGSWKLNMTSKMFLTNLFYQFDSDEDGILTYQDMKNIFSILPQPSLPPWDKKRAKILFQDTTFSRPIEYNMKKKKSVISASLLTQPTNTATTTINTAAVDVTNSGSPPIDSSNVSTHTNETPLSASGITILSAESLPTITSPVGTTGSASSPASTVSPPATAAPAYSASPHQATTATMPSTKGISVTYLDWMGYWHTLSSISPIITQQELFRLGYIEHKYSSYYLRKNKPRKKELLKKQQQQQKHLPHPSLFSMDTIPSLQFKVLVVGSQGCGKTSLLNFISHHGSPEMGYYGTHDISTAKASLIYPETRSAHVHIKKRKNEKMKNEVGETQDYESENINDVDSNKDDDDEILFTVYLIFTELPHGHEILNNNDNNKSKKKQNNLKQTVLEENYDLVLFLFDSTDASSLNFVTNIEKNQLSDGVPRAYLATKLDRTSKDFSNEMGVSSTTAAMKTQQKKIKKSEHERAFSHVVKNAHVHCHQLDIESPLLTTVVAPANSEEGTVSAVGSGEDLKEKGGGDNVDDILNNGRYEILRHIAQCVLFINNRDIEELENEIGMIGIEYHVKRLKSRPHEEQKRRDAAWRRKMIWLGGFVSFGVVVAVGVKLLLGDPSTATTAATASSSSTSSGSRASSSKSAAASGTVKNSGGGTGNTAGRRGSSFNNDCKELFIGSWISRIIFRATSTISRSTRGIGCAAVH